MNETNPGITTMFDTRTDLTRLERWIYYFSRQWILIFSAVLGLYVVFPFLAPIFMKLDWESPARAIYIIYSFLCHQLPQRSFFLFGPKFTYTLAEVQKAWQYTTDPMLLRLFIGDSLLGWKVAWSDRMVSMFTSLWLFGMLWRPLRRWLKPLPWWGLALFLFPMAADGVSHFFSDLYGIGQGFRDSNVWLAILTNHSFATNFYSGDAWGSFNSLMRLLTGILFGLGIVWFGFPFLDDVYSQQARYLESRLNFYRQKKLEVSIRASSGEQ